MNKKIKKIIMQRIIIIIILKKIIEIIIKKKKLEKKKNNNTTPSNLCLSYQCYPYHQCDKMSSRGSMNKQAGRITSKGE